MDGKTVLVFALLQLSTRKWYNSKCIPSLLRSMNHLATNTKTPKGQSTCNTHMCVKLHLQPDNDYMGFFLYIIILRIFNSMLLYIIISFHCAYAIPYCKLLYSGEDFIRWKNLCSIPICNIYQIKICLNWKLKKNYMDFLVISLICYHR